MTESEADEAGFRPLHPNQIRLLRIRTLATAAVLAGAALILDMAVDELPPLALPGAVALLGLVAAAILPKRRYRAWAYAAGEEELEIKAGLLVRTRTVIPYGRVQHIDVAHGPLQRALGLGTLVLHTAGTLGASVALPGLAHEEAERLRELIRAKIRKDLV